MHKPMLMLIIFCAKVMRFITHNAWKSLLTIVVFIPYAVATSLVIPNYPLLGGGVGSTSNILLLYDNSYSMEGELDATFKGGGDPLSRSNIARTALRSLLTNNRSKFNWGLETFQVSGGLGLIGLFDIYGGSNITMVPTQRLC